MVAVAVSLVVGAAVTAVSSLLTPTITTENEGARLDDLAVQKSNFGYALRKVFGRVRIDGTNIFWSPNITEIVTEETEEQGKGGGGSEATTTTYTYFGTWATAICEGTVTEIKKIWLNGELWYSADGDAETQQTNAQILAEHLEIYLGSSTQFASPTIQSIEGLGTVPRFINTCYLVIHDLPLADYSNRIPRVDVEVFRDTTNLRDVIDEICQEAKLARQENFANTPTVSHAAGNGFPAFPLNPGFGEIYCNELADIEIFGASLDQDGGTARELLEELERAYNFISRESNGGISFIKQERPVIYSVAVEDLATHTISDETPSRYKEIREATFEIPSRIEVEYLNRENDHESNIQDYYLPRFTHENVFSIRTRLSLDDDTAYTIAIRTAEQFITQRTKFEEIFLPFDYIVLEAGDVINTQIGNSLFNLQITEITVGVELTLEIKAVLYDNTIFTLIGETDTQGSYTPNVNIPFYGDPEVLPRDTNLVRDEDEEAGIYGAATSTSNFDGGTVYARLNGTTNQFSPQLFIPSLSRVGTAAEALDPNVAPFVVDRASVLTVTMDAGVLETATEEEFVGGNNAAIVGQDEIIYFRDVTVLGSNQYLVSHILRGRRGTEFAMGSHGTNERFILVSGSGQARRIPGSQNNIGQILDFKLVPRQRSEPSVALISTETITGASYKPYSGVNPNLIQNSGTSDLALAWLRRTRRFGELKDSIEIPLEETTEEYEIDILQVAAPYSLIRTVTTTSPVLNYPVAEQITDHGAAINSISANIYQLSSVVGRGYPLIIRERSPDLII